MKNKLLLISLSFFVSTYCLAQKRVKLTNIINGKATVVEEGQRVKYTLKTNTKVVTGVLQKVEDQTLTIDSKSVGIQELSSFGRSKEGAGGGVFLLAALGGTMIGSALRPEDDPCPSCQTVSSEGEGLTVLGDVLLIGGGITLVALAVNKGAKNSPRNLAQWKLEIVD